MIIDGFNVKIAGNELCISTIQCQVLGNTAKESHNAQLTSEIEQCIADIVKFLKKEYRKVAEGS